MISPLGLALVITLCAGLSILSFTLSLLTLDGSIFAFIVGMLIGIMGSVEWLLILIAFTLVGFFVTRYRLRAKMSVGLQEGYKGERNYRNVLANGLVPALIAVISFSAGMQGDMLPGVVYISAVSVAASDTVASEMGILSPDAVLITTMEPVPPGTDGGVSTYGTIWALMGAVFSSIIGWALIFPQELLNPLILLPMFAGFMGCVVDSVIGATLERRGKIGKLGNNILSMAFGSLLATLIFVAL